MIAYESLAVDSLPRSRHVRKEDPKTAATLALGSLEKTAPCPVLTFPPNRKTSWPQGSEQGLLENTYEATPKSFLCFSLAASSEAQPAPQRG